MDTSGSGKRPTRVRPVDFCTPSLNNCYPAPKQTNGAQNSGDSYGR